LIDLLNVLGIITSAKMYVGRCRFAFDWTVAGKQNREARLYNPTDFPEKLHDVLSEDLTNTACHLLSGEYSEKIQGALRWFRLGAGADSIEEQFHNFWLSLELAATNSKSRAKVHDPCPRCAGKLYCNKCRRHSMHRPYDKQAIQAAVEKAKPKRVDLFKHLYEARNTLLHGSRLETIAGKLPFSLEVLVDLLAEVSRQTIVNEMLRSMPTGKAIKGLHVVNFNTLVRKKLEVAARMVVPVTMTADGTLEDGYRAPAVKMSLIESP
jgi:hypothetical protein